MPIKPENKKRYPTDWRESRDRILDRDQHRCKFCKAPNHVAIARDISGGTYMLCDGGDVFDDKDGTPRGRARGSEYNAERFLYVILTIAHIDHVIEHNDDDNLAALCQKCHLSHDAAQHRENAHRTRRARKASGDLFGDK